MSGSRGCPAIDRDAAAVKATLEPQIGLRVMARHGILVRRKAE
jgi:hypothetical protein